MPPSICCTFVSIGWSESNAYQPARFSTINRRHCCDLHKHLTRNRPERRVCLLVVAHAACVFTRVATVLPSVCRHAICPLEKNKCINNNVLGWQSPLFRQHRQPMAFLTNSLQSPLSAWASLHMARTMLSANCAPISRIRH